MNKLVKPSLHCKGDTEAASETKYTMTRCIYNCYNCSVALALKHLAFFILILILYFILIIY